MKKIFLSLIILISISFGDNLLDLQSFSADFKQTIKDDEQHTIVYSGYLIIKKPYYAKWEYKKPFKKTIYVSQSKIFVVDYILEQITEISSFDDIDILAILRDADKIEKDHYRCKNKGLVFDIYFKDDNIYKISYKDNNSNDVLIEFKNQKVNQKIDKKIFKVKYPRHYDIVK